MDKPQGRGTTVRTPPGTTYGPWTWIKGYAALVALTPVWCFLWFMANVVRKLPPSITAKLLRWHIRKTSEREQDIRIPGTPTISAYMLRWWFIMRNAFFNIYLHRVFRSDDDTALHDHPWWNFSIVLDGGYWEHTILPGGVHRKVWFGPGSMQFRGFGRMAHRLELAFGDNANGEAPATTIFITGPVLRRWGFHHPEQWVDAFEWDAFCQARGIGGHKMAGYQAQLDKPKTV